MEREIPIWMTLLLILFGIGTAASFGSFLFFHAKSAGYWEEYLNQDRIKHRLVDELELAKQKAVSLDEPIKERLTRLQNTRDKISEAVTDINDNFRVEAVNHVAEIKEAVDLQERKRNSALELCRKNRLHLAVEEKTTVKNEIDADQIILELRKQVEDLSRELEMLKRENRDGIKVLDDKITGLTDRVQELKDRVDITRNDLVSDGQLLESRAASGFVIINRGINHNLRKGTLFTVYNRRGGKNINKGRIEVMKVYPLMSECRVLEEADANDPLIPGDHIHNAIYNPDEVKIFVIKGHFKTYSHIELRKFIEAVGGRVEPDLTIQSHYLVAGAEADEDIAKASNLGVIILSEDKLLEFVHSPIRFQVRRGMVFAIRGTFGDDLNLARIRRFITDNGGTISDDLDHTVNVLIAGDNCTGDIIKARTAGITVFHRSQLLHLSDDPLER